MSTSGNSVNLFQQTNPYEPYIQEMLQVDSQQKDQLQSQQTTDQNKLTAVTKIGSKLSTLNTTLQSFINDPLTQFKPFTGTSSDPSSVSVISTDGITNAGSYNIQVSQLAKADVSLSSTFSASGTSLSSSGTGSFDISIGSGSPVTISTNTAGLTNQQVLTNIANAINNQLSGKVQATVYQTSSSNVQLSIKSLNTGSANNITISNATGDLAGLNMTNLYSSSSLDAKFTIDGVSFQRSSNVVSDAIKGMTFQLNGTTSSSAKLNVSLDTKKVQSNIQNFIDQYNAAVSLIYKDTYIDGKSGQAGPLQGIRTVRDMGNNLWQTEMQTVTSLQGTGISQLADIGIDTKSDGTLYIKDSSKLQNALKTNPQGVENLFTASDGLATKMKSQIDSYITGTNSVIDTIKNGINDSIKRIKQEITQQNTYLQSKQQQYEDEFNQLQQVILQGQQQYSSIMAMQGISTNNSTSSSLSSSSSTSLLG